MHFLYENSLVEKAKELRRNMTPEERKLWYDYLCKLPVRFMRQRVIGHYILDFYCSKIKLDIEIDGLHHLSIIETEHDSIRTGKLNQLGITVIRFYNDQINNDFLNVCKQVDSIIKQMLNGCPTISKQ